MSSDDRAFTVEVTIAAPRDVVWRALTDPAELRRWFGWDYEGLEGDIRYILVEHSTPVPPDRISDDDNGWAIELVADGARTIVRVVGPGPLADAHWDDIYDEELQGLAPIHGAAARLSRTPPGQRAFARCTWRAAPCLNGAGGHWRSGRRSDLVPRAPSTGHRG